MYRFFILILIHFYQIGLFAQFDKWPIIQLKPDSCRAQAVVKDKDFNIYAAVTHTKLHFIDTTETYVDTTLVYIYKYDYKGKLLWSLDSLYFELPNAAIHPSSGLRVDYATIRDSSLFIIGKMRNTRVLTDYILEIDLNGKIKDMSMYPSPGYYAFERVIIGDYLYSYIREAGIYRVNLYDRTQTELFYQFPQFIARSLNTIGRIKDDLFISTYYRGSDEVKFGLYYLNEEAQITDSIISPYGGKQYCVRDDTLVFFYPGFIKIVDKEIVYHLENETSEYNQMKDPWDFICNSDGSFSAFSGTDFFGIYVVFFIRLNEYGEVIHAWPYDPFYMLMDDPKAILETPLGLVLAGGASRASKPGGYLVLIDKDGFMITSNQPEPTVQEKILNYFPNPVTQYLYIDNFKMMKGNIFFYDMLGRMVSNHFLTDGVNQINMSSFTPGSYIAQFVSEDKYIADYQMIIKTD